MGQTDTTSLLAPSTARNEHLSIAQLTTNNLFIIFNGGSIPAIRCGAGEGEIPDHNYIPYEAMSGQNAAGEAEPDPPQAVAGNRSRGARNRRPSDRLSPSHLDKQFEQFLDRAQQPPSISGHSGDERPRPYLVPQRNGSGGKKDSVTGGPGAIRKRRSIRNIGQGRSESCTALNEHTTGEVSGGMSLRTAVSLQTGGAVRKRCNNRNSGQDEKKSGMALNEGIGGDLASGGSQVAAGGLQTGNAENNNQCSIIRPRPRRGRAGKFGRDCLSLADREECFQNFFDGDQHPQANISGRTTDGISKPYFIPKRNGSGSKKISAAGGAVRKRCNNRDCGQDQQKSSMALNEGLGGDLASGGSPVAAGGLQTGDTVNNNQCSIVRPRPRRGRASQLRSRDTQSLYLPAMFNSGVGILTPEGLLPYPAPPIRTQEAGRNIETLDMGQLRKSIAIDSDLAKAWDQNMNQDNQLGRAGWETAYSILELNKDKEMKGPATPTMGVQPRQNCHPYKGQEFILEKKEDSQHLVKLTKPQKNNRSRIMKWVRSRMPKGKQRTV